MRSSVKDRLREGVALVRNSVALYESGDYEKALAMSGKGELMVSESLDRLGTEDGLDEAVYGDNINFGAVYHVFEANAESLFRNESDKVARVMEAIMKNWVLLDEFRVYNALTNPENVKSASSYTESVLKMAGVHSADELRESNRKLVRLMRKLKIDENVEIPDDDCALYEAIEYMITTEPSINTAAQYDNAKVFITEQVSKRNTTTSTEGIDQVYNGKIDEIAEKYHSLLNDDEKEFVSEVSAKGVDRKAIFESNKAFLVDRIGKLASTDKVNSDSWNSILERIEKKEYSEKNALADIAEMLEIRDTLDEK